MKIVIAGSGPAGAALGYILSKHGADVTLLERESDLSRVFRGEGLMPSGVDALMELGLFDLLEQMPTRKLESWDMFVNGVETMCVPEPHEELGDRAMRIIPQAQFLDAVIERASAHTGFRMIRNSNVRDLIEDDQGRVTGVTAKVDGEEREFPADLVVACDGRGSILRTRAGLSLQTMTTRYHIQWFKMPAPEQLSEGCRFLMFVSKAAMGIAYTSWDGMLQYAFTQMKDDRSEHTSEKWARLITQSTPDWLGEHIRSVSDEFVGPVRLNVISGRAEQWWKPGLLLIGDAAHPMEPVRAQGINLALRDVVVSANKLVPLLDSGGDLDAALTAIQAERELEIRHSQHLQNQDTRGIGTLYMPLMIGLAGFLGPKLGKYKWAQNAWLNQQRDLRFGSAEVKLKVD